MTAVRTHAGGFRIAWFIVAVCPIACAGAAASRSDDLVRDVRGYSDGLRWRDFPTSALRVAPAQRADFLDRHEGLDEDLRVVDWDMKRLEYDDDQKGAQVQVEYRWLLDSRGILHTTVTRQFWTRHGEHWLLDREVRVRGESMPGVPEPAGSQGEAGDSSTLNGGPEEGK